MMHDTRNKEHDSGTNVEELMGRLIADYERDVRANSPEEAVILADTLLRLRQINFQLKVSDITTQSAALLADTIVSNYEQAVSALRRTR